MAFVLVEQGPDGEQYNDYPAPTAGQNQIFPFGQKLITQDGRAYRFQKVGASTLVVGNLVDGPANITNHLSTTAAANAIGDAAIKTTLGSTLSAINQYLGGYANVVLTPGGGELYVLNGDPNVVTHAAVASGALMTATLGALNVAASGAPGGGQAGIRTALTTTSRVDMILNPYSGTIQSPITTLISHLIGVAVKASTTGRFGWIQTRGPASVLVSGTPVVGNMAVRLVAAAAAGGPSAAGTSEMVGYVNGVGQTWMTAILMIDG